MQDSQYVAILESSLKKLEELNRQQEQIEVEKAKLLQFIQATMNMLPDDAAKKLRERLATQIANIERESFGLTESIRSILKAGYPKWLTVAQVRNALIAAGFDFSSYKSNPLAAVSTTLRRLSNDDEEGIEGAEVQGVAAYRMPPKKVKE